MCIVMYHIVLLSRYLSEYMVYTLTLWGWTFAVFTDRQSSALVSSCKEIDQALASQTIKPSNYKSKVKIAKLTISESLTL